MQATFELSVIQDDDVIFTGSSIATVLPGIATRRSGSDSSAACASIDAIDAVIAVITQHVVVARALGSRVAGLACASSARVAAVAAAASGQNCSGSATC